MTEELDVLLEKDQIAEVITHLFVRTDQRDWPGSGLAMKK